MARLSDEDVREIIEVLEEELYSVPQLNKIEKMKMNRVIIAYMAHIEGIPSKII